MLTYARSNGLRLTLFAAITTAAIAFTHLLTDAQITAAAEASRDVRLRQLLPEGSYDNDLAASCIRLPADPLLGPGQHQLFVARKDNHPLALLLEVTAPNGYSGNIELLLAADSEGRILGVEVMAHKETPGLGDKIESRRSNWLMSFIGRTLDEGNAKTFAVKRDGGDFDQFSGATITPRAVVAAVANALIYLKREQASLLLRRPDCGDKR
jgi:Na+-translocating ferredoxin:NAD+ oxidoreductase subunit G